MNIIFNKLYKINIESGEVVPMPLLDGDDDLKNYITELVTKISNDSDSKGFNFQSETTEVKSQINKILTIDATRKDEYNIPSTIIAERLLREEIKIQEYINRFNVKIQKGIVVISLLNYENGSKKIIISKAENDEFIDDILHKKRGGLPVKKKIYKAFICEFNQFNSIEKLSVFDTNSTLTVYWWRDFLELEEVHTDEFNTKTAFSLIETKILEPIKKISKPDFITLWNASVHYFRTKEEFIMNEFVDTIFTNFEPYNPKIKIDDWAEKTKLLSTTSKFDNRFALAKGVINKKFRKTIVLTHQIELHMKQDIPNITNVIKPYESEDGVKYVMIKSDEGYEYFKKQEESDANSI